MVPKALYDAASALRLTPLILLFAVITMLGLKQSPVPRPASPTPITRVVLESKQPRRAMLVTLLLLASFTYFLDGLIVAVRALWTYKRDHESHLYRWRGVGVADIAGVLAFFGIALLGIHKEKRGVDFWTRRRVRTWAVFALLFDIAYLVLMLLTHDIFYHPPNGPHVPEIPKQRGIYLPNFLQFLVVDIRIITLLILIVVLFKPSTVYSTVQRQLHESPGPSTTLLPANGDVTIPSAQVAYGTFHDAEQGGGLDGAKTAVDYQDAHLKPSLPPTGKKHAEGYEVDESTTTPGPSHDHLDVPAASSKRSSKSSRNSPSASREVLASNEPDGATLPKDPEIESVKNEPTDDSTKLKTSYAANAATALENERERERNEEGTDKRDHDPAYHARPSDSNDKVSIAKESDGKSDAPVTFPAGITDSPVMFPAATRDDASSVRAGGISFRPDVNGTPRPESPDVSGENKEKRKRISSQNFQKMVRRVSLVPKRTGSSTSSGSKADPGTSTPKKEGSSFLSRFSREDSSRTSGDGYSTPRPDSPASMPDPGAADKAERKKMIKRKSLKL